MISQKALAIVVTKNSCWHENPEKVHDFVTITLRAICINTSEIQCKPGLLVPTTEGLALFTGQCTEVGGTAFLR